MDDYLPIDCGLHSEYELMAMHRSSIRLVYEDAGGEIHQDVGRVIDVITRDRAEYLVLECPAQPVLRVRLDKIHGFTLLGR